MKIKSAIQQTKSFPAEASPTVGVTATFTLIVPTLRVVTSPRTLRVPQMMRTCWLILLRFKRNSPKAKRSAPKQTLLI